MLKVEQHIVGAFGRAERLEGLVDEMLGLVLDELDFAPKPVHHRLPRNLLTDVERVERHLFVDQEKGWGEGEQWWKMLNDRVDPNARKTLGLNQNVATIT